jgi:EAL domain-containing protein (putative c-di-GMP-specific phosphodiesterase class I)
VDFYQGYLLGRPMVLDDVLDGYADRPSQTGQKLNPENA